MFGAFDEKAVSGLVLRFSLLYEQGFSVALKWVFLNINPCLCLNSEGFPHIFWDN